MTDREHQAELERTGFWGKRGAGSLVLAEGQLLVNHRSSFVLEPDTWGTWGGAIDGPEDPAKAAVRELREETGYKDAIDEIVPLLVYRHSSGFVYHNFLLVVPKQFSPRLDWESQDFRWCDWPDLPKPRHPGLSVLLSHAPSRAKITRAINKWAVK